MPTLNLGTDARPDHAPADAATKMGNSTLTLEQTTIFEVEGYRLPAAKIDGRWYLIETKPNLLKLGIASAIALTETFETDFVNRSPFTATLPADPENGRPTSIVLHEATDAPAVVALARRFAEKGTLD